MDGTYSNDVATAMAGTTFRAGGSAKVAKVLAFASFGLQLLESVNYVDMSCNVFTS